MVRSLLKPRKWKKIIVTAIIEMVWRNRLPNKCTQMIHNMYCTHVIVYTYIPVVLIIHRPNAGIIPRRYNRFGDRSTKVCVVCQSIAV